MKTERNIFLKWNWDNKYKRGYAAPGSSKKKTKFQKQFKWSWKVLDTVDCQQWEKDIQTK